MSVLAHESDLIHSYLHFPRLVVATKFSLSHTHTMVSSQPDKDGVDMNWFESTAMGVG